MRAIILAAGGGSRLLPLTLTRPKCLVPVDGRAILDHQLEALAAAGVTEAVVIGGYRIGDVDRHLAAGTPLPVSLRHNPFWHVSSSIGSVWMARDLLGDPFCLLNGDTIVAPGIIRDALATERRIGLLVEPLPGDGGEPDDMRVLVADGRVRAVAKTLGAATHRSLGVVVAQAPGRMYVEALDTVIGGGEGPLAYHHAVIDLLAGSDSVAALERGAGRWQEIDRVEDIDRWDAHGG